jgi:oxygen-independent coproporphyrinogen-3 oxidase
MKLAATHISLYQLTIEKATPFYSMYKKGDLTIPEQDLAADMYQWSLDYLRSLGYKRYEISNYARRI